MELTWKERLVLYARWKLKYTLRRPERSARDLSYRLYHRLCPAVRESAALGQQRARELSGTGYCAAPALAASDELLAPFRVLCASPQAWQVNLPDGELAETEALRRGLSYKNAAWSCLRHLGFDPCHRLVERLFGPILRGYYRAHYRLADAMALKYIAFPVEQAESSFLWHTDEHPPGTLKGFIYLSDVAPENGPFAYVPGSHAVSHLAHQLTGNTYESRYSEEYVSGIARRLGTAPGMATGPAGTAFIFNNNCLHRATPVKAGVRLALQFTFLPSFFETRRHHELRGCYDIWNMVGPSPEPVWRRA